MLIVNVLFFYVVLFGGDWLLLEDGVIIVGLCNLCLIFLKRVLMVNERLLFFEFVFVVFDGDVNLCGMFRFGGVMFIVSVCGKKVVGGS